MQENALLQYAVTRRFTGQIVPCSTLKSVEFPEELIVTEKLQHNEVLRKKNFDINSLTAACKFGYFMISTIF